MRVFRSAVTISFFQRAQIKRRKSNMASDSGSMDDAKATKFTGWLVVSHIYGKKDFPRVVPRLSFLFGHETLDKLLSFLALVWPNLDRLL